MIRLAVPRPFIAVYCHILFSALLIGREKAAVLLLVRTSTTPDLFLSQFEGKEEKGEGETKLGTFPFLPINLAVISEFLFA